MNWYYVDGPNRLGPISEADWAELVRSGKIDQETLVWHEPLPNWIPFSQLAPSPLPEVEEESEPLEQAEVSEEERAQAFAARILDRDYLVDTSGCIGRSWQLFKA